MPLPLDFERFLNIRKAYGPQFSRDGRRITFLTDITGVPQLWAIEQPGSWPTQLTFAPERILYAIGDCSRGRMILGSDTGGDEHVQLYLLAEDEITLTPLDHDPAVIHTFGGWSPDDRSIAYASNARNEAYFDIYTLDVDAADTKPRMVYRQDGSNTVQAWSPDCSALLVSNTEKPSNDNLYIVPLDGSEPRLLTPHEGDAVYLSAQWSPDGKSIYVVTDEACEFAALVRIDVDTGERETLAAQNWDVEFCLLSDDGRRLAYSVNESGYSTLHVLDSQTGEDTTSSGLPAGVTGTTGSSASDYANIANWSPDGNRLAFSFSAPTRNLDVWVWDLENGQTQQLTTSGRANLPQSIFAEPELVTYSTFDRRSIPAFLFLPNNIDSPAPCVVIVHGGPESQARPTFDPVVQYFVYRGYAVLVPNVRGSTGYGREYEHLDDVRLRMDSVKDLAAAVDWLRGSGTVDPARIAVMGGSYGGFMVLAAVTTYPDLWAAAVDIVGIANFATFLENTGPWRRKLREAEYGSLQNDADFLKQISPIYYVDKIKAPLMVIHGANDPRVPVGEAEQIVASLRERGMPVEYLRFEDEGHGIAKLKNRLVAYPAIGDFLDKYLHK
jgi:dipeptidyl aminopeptidase/acylaminoacyl peptidase